MPGGDAADLFQVAGFRMPVRDDQGIRCADFLNGVVQPLVVIPLRLGHSLRLAFRGVIGLPQIQQGIRIADIQAADINPHRGEPVHHTDPVRIAQQLVQPLFIRVRETQRFGGSPRSVIQGYIGTRLCEGSHADHLQGIAGIDQGIDQHRQQNDHKDHKTCDKFGRVENLPDCILHNFPPPLLRIELSGLDPRIDEAVDDVQQERDQQHHNGNDQGRRGNQRIICCRDG